MNEFTLLQRLLADVPPQGEGLLCGVGDDCAVLTGSGVRDWLVTADAFLEGIHFRREWATWAAIGRKAVLAGVSDVAAMGGRPRFCFVTMAIPDDVRTDAVAELYAGIREAVDGQQMLIAGGDTNRSKRGVILSLTIVGEVAHGRAIYRRGARPGDHVYVTGLLGGSNIGLTALQRRLNPQTYAAFIKRHFEPAPRVAAASWLAATGCLTAMIDVSDGLVADLGHIAAAGQVGMRIDAIRVPSFPEAAAVFAEWGEEPFAGILASGEEYELVFTVAGARAEAFRRLLPAGEKTLGHAVTPIGVVTPGSGITVVDPVGAPLELSYHGFVHEFADGA
ncbi:MAG: thiamine-phosphate kinase [Deltaproteobacteria bacterium]|nr:thiamine-phosphate kinase [Deltaproteobacteria bacterium]